MSDRPRRVFVSYSQDSTAHSERVLELAQWLRDEGIDCMLDQFEVAPPQGWPMWMHEQVRDADLVLVVASRGYHDKFENDVPPNAGKGVKFESCLILQDFYDAGARTDRFVPVLFDHADEQFLIKPLKSQTWQVVADARGREQLRQRITGQRPAKRQPRPLGQVKKLTDEEPGDNEEPARRQTQSGPIRRARWEFVGRASDFAWLEEQLAGAGGGQIVVLHGPPGVGKSALAQEYGRRHAADYPFGKFVVPARHGPFPELARLGRVYFDLRSDGLSIEEQGERTALRLARERCLLIYDDLRDAEELSRVLPPSEACCDIVVTSNWEDWRSQRSCAEYRIAELDRTDAEAIIKVLGSAAVFARFGEALIREAGGIAAQLCPAIQANRKRFERDPNAVYSGGVSSEAGSSFSKPWEVLSDDARVLLGVAALLNPQRIDVELLRLSLAEYDDAFSLDAALDECLDLHLLEGHELLVMHQLFARYVRGLGAAPESLRNLVFARLRVAAAVFTESPRIADLAMQLDSYSLGFEVWSASLTMEEQAARDIGQALLGLGRFADALPWYEWAVTETMKGEVHGFVDRQNIGSDLHQVGYCQYALGRFTIALTWYEQAVTAEEQGDIHGHVDHQGLGKSLHQVGSCLLSLGRFSEALPWFERAVAEAEQGDVHGRVDHQDIGAGLHQVGSCLLSLGRFSEALPWFERAVAEVERGGVGGVNHENLGTSIHLVGDCHWSLGHFAEALPWHERAVVEKEQGDVHGRVDHQSVGMSLHQVGSCLSGLGRFAEALPRFERAAAEKGLGDVHGRVDHQVISASLHHVGYCHGNLGSFADALPWFELAVAEAEQGDVHGLINHQSLGTSIQDLGDCYASLGRFVDALLCFERAVIEKEQGDVHGRVDHQSLGTSLKDLGDCYASLGRFAEALPWFERALVEEGQGNVHGRVDHQSLGVSLHRIGHFYFGFGRFAEALPWFERAVAEAEQGDIHGLVDHQTLGANFYQVGYCYFELGRLAEALPWFERAVVEAEQGDGYRHVDHEILGRSLHEVGYCHYRIGRSAEALPWFERAVAEKEQGDLYGHVNYRSLATSLTLVGYCHVSLGRLAEALPRFVRAWFERAVAKAKEGDVHVQVDHQGLGTNVRSFMTGFGR